MPTRRTILPSLIAVAMVSIAGCGGHDTPTPPTGPTPPPVLATANAYILPGAVSMGEWAFGDEPVVIYKGERLRWINGDTLTHLVVADSPETTDFGKTAELRAGDEQSFIMTKLGSTKIHCTIHPNMTGTLIVRER